MTIVEMRQQRGQMVTQMRALTDKAAAEKRALTAEEDAQWQKIDADQEALRKEIEALEKADTRQKRMASLEAEVKETRSTTAADPATGKPAPAAAAEQRTNPRESAEYRSLFNRFLAEGQRALSFLSDEVRNTLQVDSFTKGGALVTPQEFISELLKGLDDDVFVRKYARKFRLASAASLGVPQLDGDVEDHDWTSELLTGNQGTMTFGKRELRPHPLAKRIKVSKTLSRVSTIPMDQLVRERLQYKLRITQEKAYFTGDGVQKPLGVFVPSNDGIPTSRDFLTGSATDITGDGLIDAKSELKQAYHKAARWAFHRKAVAKIRKLKDSQGQYLWQPALTGGNPDLIVDLPYDVSEYVPNTFTTGQYVGILAVWNFYWIVDALDLGIEFLDQLYAEANQNGYIARYEGDAQPVLAEAFVRLKTN